MFVITISDVFWAGMGALAATTYGLMWFLSRRASRQVRGAGQ